MKIKISFWAAAALAAASVFYRGAIPVVLCAAVHELGHLAAISAFRADIREIRVGISGICIESGPLVFPADAICAAAGPAAGLVLAALCIIAKATQAAEISFFLSILNLLPVRPLDGSKVTSAAAQRLLGPAASSGAISAANAAFAVVTVILCIVMSICAASYPPLLFAIFIVAENLKN